MLVQRVAIAGATDLFHHQILGSSGRLIAPKRSKATGPRVLFTYFGRRGLSEFVLRLAEAVPSAPIDRAVFSVSRQNDRFQDFQQLGDKLEPVDTFHSGLGALCAWRVQRIRQQIFERVRRDRIDAVVSLMSHVWTGLISPSARAGGARIVSVVHDAVPHQGDLRSSLGRCMPAGIKNSDLVVTLSHHVTDQLKAGGTVDPARVRTLFHPHLNLGAVGYPKFPNAGEAFRLLFLGRILPYKGLHILLDAVESLQRQGLNLKLGVFGEGALGANRSRLEAIGAEVCNRWLAAGEISAVLGRYHAVALPHCEASQSGVAALALGHGLPVVASPVGGLVEQITDSVTGIMAASADANALAASINYLARDRAFYNGLVAGIRLSQHNWSMENFVSRLAENVREVCQQNGS